MLLSTATGAKLTPEAVEEACARVRDDVHQVQPAALSITNATEYGLVYRAAEVAALGEVAKRRGLGFHMDGARFANAVAFTGDEPGRPDLARGRRRAVVRLRQEWRDERRGADLLRPELAAEVVPRRRKRAGHLLSKGRYLAAQILAMLEDDLWLANARAANARRADARRGGGPDRLVYPVEANELFLRMTADEAAALRAQGFDFYDWGAGRSPAGDQLGPGHGGGRRGSPRRSPRCEPSDRTAAHRRVDRRPVHHLHRRSGDRPGSSSATSSATVPPQWSVDLPLRHRRGRDGAGRASGRASR